MHSQYWMQCANRMQHLGYLQCHSYISQLYITAVFDLLRDTDCPKYQLTKNHIAFGQTEAWSRSSVGAVVVVVSTPALHVGDQDSSPGHSTNSES